MNVEGTEEHKKLCEILDKELNEHNDPYVQGFIRLSVEHVVVFAKKQHDYGPKNISDFGEQGVLVRVNDKISRLKNLLVVQQADLKQTVTEIVHSTQEQGGNLVLNISKAVWSKIKKQFSAEPSCESVLDTWQDLSIYGQIAEMVRRGLWK